MWIHSPPGENLFAILPKTGSMSQIAKHKVLNDDLVEQNFIEDVFCVMEIFVVTTSSSKAPTSLVKDEGHVKNNPNRTIPLQFDTYF